jgi:hypothetical protein
MLYPFNAAVADGADCIDAVGQLCGDREHVFGAKASTTTVWRLIAERIDAGHLPQIHAARAATPSSAATCLLDCPAAQRNTTRHPCANACEDFDRRAHRCNVSRSQSVNANSATGLPLLATPLSPQLIN